MLPYPGMIDPMIYIYIAPARSKSSARAEPLEHMVPSWVPFFGRGT